MSANALPSWAAATIRVVAGDRLTGEIVAGALGDLMGTPGSVGVIDRRAFDLIDQQELHLVIALDDVDIAVIIHNDAADARAGRLTPPARVASLDQLARLACRGLGIPEFVAVLRPLEPRRQRAWSEHLTDRELEVLQEMRRGCDNSAIAESLGISGHTVRSHVGNILRKLGTSSRVEAIARSS